MTAYSASPGDAGAGSVDEQAFIEPSFLKALPHFLLLLVFPLVGCAALYGGWWLVGPFLFIWVENMLDLSFGIDERNMDPWKPRARQLLMYELAFWSWAVLWPALLVFVLWQIFVADHLSLWEAVLTVFALGIAAQMVFIVGHELAHKRAVWERRFGEFLLASVTYPHYATEHVYIHHPQVGTPADLGSAPKGQSFWEYLPRDVANNLLVAWRFEADRLARRQLPWWHHTNPFWRYALLVAFWYALGYWIGGIWGLLVFLVMSCNAVFSMKNINYIQHYGLQRIRLPNGRFERPQSQHSWSSGYRFFNWVYYNAQRHADHHAAAARPYPLLQHWREDKSPRLPGPYGKMGGLALLPKRWFKTMDPLVDRWREQFYPEIKDWSVYDSPAFAACPDAYETIVEIMGAAPRLSRWINRAPELLDSLRDKEFTDLDLPDGFGSDPEFERIARRGLTRVYWTLEFRAAAMKEQVFDIPVQDAKDAVEILRNWSNDKAFQVAVHTLRGNLSPVEAGVALSDIAEATIAGVLAAVMEDSPQPRVDGGVVAIMLGDLACGEATLGAELDFLFLYASSASAEHYQTSCHRFLKALHQLSQGSLLLSAAPRAARPVRSLTDFAAHHRCAQASAELAELTRARCVFVSGAAGLGEQFEDTRRALLADSAARTALLNELRQAEAGEPKPGLRAFESVRGGLRDLERAARLLQVSHAAQAPALVGADAVSVFQTAAEQDLIPDDVAGPLAETARTWRNLHGILRLLAENDDEAEMLAPPAEAVIAKACGVNDFNALTAAIEPMAARSARCVDALFDAR